MSAFVGSHLSHNEATSDEIKKAVYARQNSPIFAPFMIHIACSLLNDCKHGSLIDIEATIASWGGGLRQLRECYHEWDQRVSECCKITAINHPIWKQFVQHHNVSISSTHPISILQQLLHIWRNSGQQNRTFGPYPSSYEQHEYQNVCIVPIGYLSEAIMQLKFEAAFKANNCDIETYIAQNRSQTMDQDTKEEKYDVLDPQNPLNDTMPWNYDEIIRRSPPTKAINNNDNNMRRYASNKSRNGILYYQSAYFTAAQCTHIANHFKMNRDAAPLLLFGDNNIDKNRDKKCQQRQFYGGQSEFVGAYDDWFAFGIITTWKHKRGSTYFQGNAQAPNYNAFKLIIDEEFAVLAQYLQDGRDIIIPAPTKDAMRQQNNKYYEDDILQVRHNLGTGIADLNMNYLKYIQFKLDELQRYAQDIKYSDYCISYETQNVERENNGAMWNINNLSFDTTDVDNNKRNDIRQRLGFDHEEKQRKAQDSDNDRFGSLLYHSPQHKPQKRSGYIQNRDINIQQSNEYNNVQMMQDKTLHNLQNNTRTPYSNSGNKRKWFHYKSPSGYVEDEHEYWQLCSPSKREKDGFSSSGSAAVTSIKSRKRNDVNVLYNAISCCLAILFYYPRKMYIALVVQNRPQDVIRIMSCLCMIFAAVSCVIGASVTSAALLWILMAIFFAYAGGDQFYQQRHHQRHTFYE